MVSIIKDRIIKKLDIVQEILLYNFNQKLIPIFIKSPNIDSMNETLEKLIEGDSICRYGDGEVDLILGRSQGFQKQDKKLAKRLKNIIKFNGKHPKLIVAIPDVFDSVEQFTDSAQLHWKIRLDKERYKWYLLLNRSKSYGNSQITRFYFDWKDKTNSRIWIEKLKSIWKDKDILIVEGKKSRLGVGNDLFNNTNSIKRIICPSENAFSKYNDILAEILNYDKERIVLIALGPTATVLAYDLFIQGYQAVDIGHIDIEYEWYITNAKIKLPIKGKYVNEVENGNIVEDINDEKYLMQIDSIVSL